MTLTIPPLSIAPNWRRVLPVFVLLLLAVLLLYRETGLAMVGIWERSETFAHAFVVPPISLWLIWRQRARLALLSPQAAPIFLLPFAGVMMLWLVGQLAAVNAATQFALTGMLVLLVPVTLGWPVARCIAFPLGFLFFAVPFGEFVMPQLMEWTAHFTVAALRASGIPVYQEGLQFIIPSGNWSVVEACSGIRYLMASMMVGTLFAYLNYRSIRRRWIFVGVSVALPLVANWLRAYMIVMLGHLSGNTLATGADHLIYGWVFFGIIMLVMFMIGARWAEPDAPPPDAAAVARAEHQPAAPLHLPVLVALALMLATPALWLQGLHGLDDQAPPTRAALKAPDLALQGWQQSDAPVANFKPNFELPRGDLQTGFSRGTAQVGLYVAYYHQQNFESKLISSNNMLVVSKDKDWARVSGDVARDDQQQTLRTTELRGAALGNDVESGRLRVWQIYWVGGRWTSSDWRAKLYAAAGRLVGQGDAAAVLVMYAPKSAAGAGDAMLASFWNNNREKLGAWLGQIAPSRDGQSAPGSVSNSAANPAKNSATHPDRQGTSQ